MILRLRVWAELASDPCRLGSPPYDAAAPAVVVLVGSLGRGRPCRPASCVPRLMPKRLSVDRSTPTPLPPPRPPAPPSAGGTASMLSAADCAPRPPTVAPALPGPPRRGALPPAPAMRVLSPRGGSRPRLGELPKGSGFREAAPPAPLRAATPAPRSRRPNPDDPSAAAPPSCPPRNLAEPSALCGGAAPAGLALDRRGVPPPPLRRSPDITPSATARRIIALPCGTAWRKDLSRSFSCESRSLSACSASILRARSQL